MTDKELTAEIVAVFIESWHSRTNTVALDVAAVTDLIKSVHETFSNLTDSAE